MKHLINLSMVAFGATGMYYTLDYVKPKMCHCSKRLDGKTVVITGANTGIGKETARELNKRGARIVMACRDVEKGKIAAEDILLSDDKTVLTRGDIEVYQLDLASLKSVKRFVETVKKNESEIDILINNAGVVMADFSRTEDGFEKTIGTNYFGHFYLTNLLLDILKENPNPTKILNVSSNAHKRAYRGLDVDDINYEKKRYSSFLAYSESKLANILHTVELKERLKNTKINAYALHPGFVKTNLFQHLNSRMGENLQYYLWKVLNIFAKTPIEGAQTTVYCAVEDCDKLKVGSYYSNCAEAATSKHAKDKILAKKLWEVSEDLINSSIKIIL